MQNTGTDFSPADREEKRRWETVFFFCKILNLHLTFFNGFKFNIWS